MKTTSVFTLCLDQPWADLILFFRGGEGASTNIFFLLLSGFRVILSISTYFRPVGWIGGGLYTSRLTSLMEAEITPVILYNTVRLEP